jgi:hypothetical protein
MGLGDRIGRGRGKKVWREGRTEGAVRREGGGRMRKGGSDRNDCRRNEEAARRQADSESLSRITAR